MNNVSEDFTPQIDVNSYFLATGITEVEKDKVKCTLVQALRLCTDRTALRVSRGIVLPFIDHGTRRG